MMDVVKLVTGVYTLIVLMLLLAGLVFLMLLERLVVPMDPDEPPPVWPAVPFIGHIVGMTRHQVGYFQILSDRCRFPAFTIPLLTSKMYIITSPPMIQAAMCAKTLSFDQLAVLLSIPMFGYSPLVVDIISSSKTNEKGLTYMGDIHIAMHEPMMPGPALQRMNTCALAAIRDELGKIGKEFETRTLWPWLQETFAMASGESLFGAKNPFRDPALVRQFWDFETGALKLFARPLNFLTARKAYLGRKAVHTALRDYFSAGYDHNDDASLLIKARTAVNRKWGFSPTDVADAETSMIFVSTTNAVPTIFWMFCYVFSNAQLSDELRNEVASAVTRQGSGDCVIDIAKFAQACPLINSVYQEVMRLTNVQNGTRFVMEDTVLEQPAYDGMPPRTIRLAKGTMVQMPASLVHVSPAVWGANASTFDARRFLKADQKENGREANDSIQPDKRQKKLFYPFGGGRHLCPGRHLAYAEILGTMTMLLLGYDITDARGGLVTLPQKADLRFSGVKHPLGPDAVMAIRIRRKRGWEGVRWVFSSGGAK